MSHIGFAFLALGLIRGSTAFAHVPEEGTARITLRDNHLEILAEWDLFRLMDASPTDIATASEEKLIQVHLQLVRAIEMESLFSVDGERRPVVVRGFPTPPELRALAATVSASNHDHGALARVRLEVMESAEGARNVSFVTPARLGWVNVSFVQPTHRFVQGGTPASFGVLEPSVAPSEPEGRQSHPAENNPYVGWLTAFLAGAFAALTTHHWFQRRRSSS